MASHSQSPRSAFSLIEAMVALALISVLGVIVVQCMLWSTLEQRRLAARQAALELAVNILEAGRAQPWEKLDKAWADRLTIPSEMQALLPEGKILAELEPDQKLPHARRLSVEVHWQFEPDRPAQKVQLHSLISARMSKKPGEKS